MMVVFVSAYGQDQTDGENQARDLELKKFAVMAEFPYIPLGLGQILMTAPPEREQELLDLAKALESRYGQTLTFNHDFSANNRSLSNRVCANRFRRCLRAFGTEGIERYVGDFD